MRRTAAIVVLAILAPWRPAFAQDERPPIGPFVVDLRANFPRFPDEQALAESRSLVPGELPGRGIGFDVGAHVYLFTWKAMTFGVGGQITMARARFSPPEEPASELRVVTERVSSIAPQVSFNFGTGDGWSYLSAGVGTSQWSVIPDGQPAGPADEERLLTFNYGGGARWFSNPHVAFTFDVRFHAIDAGTVFPGRPGAPRTRLLVMGAGISVK